MTLADPLVLSLSDDGVHWDRAFDVRDSCPPRRYPGRAKGPGYQYPGAVVVGSQLLVSYSVNKEDIAVSIIDVSF